MGYKDKDKQRAWDRAYYAKNKEKRSWKRIPLEARKNSQLKTRYGITLEDYNKLVVKQDNRCAVCGVITKNLFVDHNHTTGKVRGLLCNRCNRAIGMLEDSTRLLANAINYLVEND